MKTASLRELFAADPARARAFSLEACGWYLDYSKNRITAETMRLLQALCPMADLRGEIDAMFSGKKINGSRPRHAALLRQERFMGWRVAPSGVSVVDGTRTARRGGTRAVADGGGPGRVRASGQYARRQPGVSTPARDMIFVTGGSRAGRPSRRRSRHAP